MRINPVVYGILVLVAFMGTIGLFQAAGIWSVSGKVTADGETAQPLATDVNTIKGWMTLDQITTTYNVSLVQIIQQFELPADTTASTAIKDLESDLFSVTNLRTWLESRTEPAVALPTNTAVFATPQINTPIPEITIEITQTPTVHVAPERTVTGKTTFQDLLDWGVKKDFIEQTIGGALPAPSILVKDFATGNGLDFPTIKSIIQAEVDKTK